MESTVKILLVGYGRAGKDEGLSYLSKLTGLANAGTTSIYLAKYVAEKLGVSDVEAYRDRHKNRDLWYRIGNELRANDPGILMREAFQVGPLSGGVRDLEEILVARKDPRIIIAWIENERVPIDQTVKFGPEHCTTTIYNNGSLAVYHENLKQFAKFAGLI